MSSTICTLILRQNLKSVTQPNILLSYPFLANVVKLRETNKLCLAWLVNSDLVNFQVEENVTQICGAPVYFVFD